MDTTVHFYGLISRSRLLHGGGTDLRLCIAHTEGIRINYL